VTRSPTPDTLLTELPFVHVLPDEYAILESDGVLMANLQASIGICIYDAVFEPGALLHLKALPDKSVEIELTDVVLAGDLLLLEQALAALRATAPRAQYWQGKILTHCPPHDPALSAIAQSVAEFAADWLTDAGVQIVDRQMLEGRRARVQFRPQMGQLRTAKVHD
jgi:chemotaxis receptor (MCP) glutamine deamidase CheD